MKWLKKGQLPSKVKEIIVSKVGKDKNGRDKSIVIYCKKKGVCSSDRKLVRGQNIFVRGDVNASIRKICTDVSRAIVECTI
jgi:hypothetical protein|nr:MAG TPA: hypothetical protein [Caudoviricetes sp.]